MKEPCGFSWGMRFRNPLVASTHMKNTIRISYVCKQVSQELWSINSIKTIVYLEFVWYKWCHVQVKSPIKLWCFFFANHRLLILFPSHYYRDWEKHLAASDWWDLQGQEKNIGWRMDMECISQVPTSLKGGRSTPTFKTFDTKNVMTNISTIPVNTYQ